MKKVTKNKRQKNDWQEFKLPTGKQPIFKFFSKILFKPIFGAKTESVIEDLPDKAIVVSIHAAKNGPMAISMSYPKYAAMWGHHDMLGTYKERFLYLRNVLYIQKMHKNKFIATIKALYEAVFSIYIRCSSECVCNRRLDILSVFCAKIIGDDNSIIRGILNIVRDKLPLLVTVRTVPCTVKLLAVHPVFQPAFVYGLDHI